MRQSQNGKRSRGNRRNNSNTNRTIDSNGPEVKIRGSASHIYEKYQSLAREANIAGERIVSESYLQHAEHYYRQMNQTPAGNSRGARPEGQGESDNDQRRDNQAKFVPAPANGNGSGETEVVATEVTSENETATNQEVLAGLPAAAPQQPRRRRARGRRHASDASSDSKASSAESSKVEAKNDAPEATTPDASEDGGATKET